MRRRPGSRVCVGGEGGASPAWYECVCVRVGGVRHRPLPAPPPPRHASYTPPCPPPPPPPFHPSGVDDALAKGLAASVMLVTVPASSPVGVEEGLVPYPDSEAEEDGADEGEDTDDEGEVEGEAEAGAEAMAEAEVEAEAEAEAGVEAPPIEQVVKGESPIKVGRRGDGTDQRPGSGQHHSLITIQTLPCPPHTSIPIQDGGRDINMEEADRGADQAAEEGDQASKEVDEQADKEVDEQPGVYPDGGKHVNMEEV